MLQPPTPPFFFFKLLSSELDGVPTFSGPFPGVSTLTNGAPILVGIVLCGCFAVAVRSTSLALDMMNDPGSPTNGFSSMYSSSYLRNRCSDSASVLVSWNVEAVFPACDPTNGTLAGFSASGIGVFSLLC